MKRNVVRSLVALGTVSAACHDTPQLAVRTTNHDVPRREQLPPDSLLARLVATVPGFGGLYLDETGRAAVYLRDVRQRAAADTVLAAYRPIRVLHGEYTYKELGGWFERLSPEVLGLFGVVLVDLDEAKNRLLVGVVDSTAAAAVR